jgi:hypothetical protein
MFERGVAPMNPGITMQKFLHARPDADGPSMTWAPGTAATSSGERELVGDTMGDVGR